MQQKTEMRMSPKKTLFIMGGFGLFALLLSSFFVLNTKKASADKAVFENLLLNSDFESWKGNNIQDWKKNEVKIFKEKSDVISGSASLAIYNPGPNENDGVTQTIDLDPKEIYNLFYSLKSNSLDPNSAGVILEYEGDNVITTMDAAQGTHLHSNGKSWHTYFGKVTGATKVSIRFFSKNNAIAYIDNAGIGVNLKPVVSK